MLSRRLLFVIVTCGLQLLPRPCCLGADDAAAPIPSPADAADSAAPAKEPPAKSEKAVAPPVIPLEELRPGKVRVEIFEHPVEAGSEDAKPATKKAAGEEPATSWSALPPLKTDEYEETAFGFSGIVEKYDAQGIRVDRSEPFLVRAAAAVTLPAGECRLLVRALSGARLAVDGRELAVTEILKQRTADVEAVPDQAKKQLVPSMPLLPPGHREAMASFTSDGQPHVFTLEVFVGGKAIRPELGEVFVAVAAPGQPFSLLGAVSGTDELRGRAWKGYAFEQQNRLRQLNAARRHNDAEEAYWKMRHALAREHAGPAVAVPATVDGTPGRGEIDRFLDARLIKAGVEPSAGISDAAFLRRVTLDATGLLPSSQEVADFARDSSPQKRAQSHRPAPREPALGRPVGAVLAGCAGGKPGDAQSLARQFRTLPVVDLRSTARQ